MAEAHLDLLDSSFVPHEELTASAEEKVLLNSTETLQVLSDTDLTAINDTAEEVSIQEHKIQPEKESYSSEDGHVESPTTGESFVYKCVFCEHILTGNDEPKLLECLHNACGNCISNKICEQNESSANNKGYIECASCSMLCEFEKIIDNHFLLELSSGDDVNNSKLNELKCSSCSDDAISSSWCMDCSEYICDNCVQAHQRLKITKDHTIKPKEDGYLENQASASGSGSTNLFCTIHPHEKLSLFCEHCDKLTCRDCQLIEHRDHKYKFTHEIAADTRKFINAMLKDVSYKRVLLNSAMKVIADRQTLISDKKQALVKEITQLVVKLTNTINVRGKQLVSRLSEVCESKQKTLQEKKVALEQLSKMTDHCIEFTQHALENGSDMALLFSKKQVTSHLQRIKCKRADIPNPEIPVRIHLALEKVPDLLKVISTIGQIVVDGRIYPAPPTSPATSLPPHGSPSPVNLRPSASPINNHYQQQQTTPPGFQQPRLIPPYGQYSQNIIPQNMASTMLQNLQHNLSGPKVGPNMGHMQTSPSISLAQQLSQNYPAHMQRMPTHRGPIPRGMMAMNRHPSQSLHQQQVTSSTHPQGMMQERPNLRGLLQPNGNAVYVQTGPSQYQAVQPQYAQQFQSRYANHQVPYRQQPPMRMMPPTPQNRIPMQRIGSHNQMPGFQSPPQHSPAKWHIPQQGSEYMISSGISMNRLQSMPSLNENYKITLKSQNSIDKPATVTSTIPKTPSPNHVQGKSDTERSLDKYCEESVNDLMATIAKLDSNGVQVLAEGRPKMGGSPLVDSSTDDGMAGSSGKLKSESMDIGKDDPNEDWCAVCMDGGELVCCDKCPKVFHQFCHIPNLSVEESDTWQCLLCMNFADVPDGALMEQKDGELTTKEKKIAERIVLELYCQYEPSLPFREVIGAENIDYHNIIKKPIALDTIRHRLDWNAEEHYTNMEQLVRDVRIMFRNAYTFNVEDTQVYTDAKTLEKFFDQQLEKFLPQYAYEMFEDEDELHPPSKKFKRIICD